MKSPVREIIVEVAAHPQKRLQLLAAEIARCRRRKEIARARPLAYALMGLAVEHGVPARSLRAQVAWLLDDPETNDVVARRVHAFAKHIADVKLAAAAERRVAELEGSE